jgi:hypothetical protein
MMLLKFELSEACEILCLLSDEYESCVILGSVAM